MPGEPTPVQIVVPMALRWLETWKPFELGRTGLGLPVRLWPEEPDDTSEANVSLMAPE